MRKSPHLPSLLFGFLALLYLIAGVVAFRVWGFEEAFSVGVVGMMIEAVWGLGLHLPRRKGPKR